MLAVPFCGEAELANQVEMLTTADTPAIRFMLPLR
jgi:hypothetical protein